MEKKTRKAYQIEISHNEASHNDLLYKYQQNFAKRTHKVFSYLHLMHDLYIYTNSVFGVKEVYSF